MNKTYDVNFVGLLKWNFIFDVTLSNFNKLQIINENF